MGGTKKKQEGQIVHTVCPSGLNEEIFQLIKRRRLQMLVHSFLYYKYDKSIIHDRDFDHWAIELVGLQKKYPRESEAVEFYEDFKYFDGTTGFDLPLYHPFIEGMALRLLREHEKRTGEVFQ